MKYTEALRRTEAGTDANLLRLGTSLQDGKPQFFDVNADNHILVGSGKGKHGFRIDERYDVTPSAEATKEWGRRGNLVIGQTVGDIDSHPVVLNLPEFTDPTTGQSDDYLWVGTCATEEQAIRGWEMLGQPGDRDTTVSALMRLLTNQFILRNRKTDFTQMIEVDAAYLAALAERRGVEE